MVNNNTGDTTIHDVKLYVARIKLFYLELFSFISKSCKKYWFLIAAGMLLGAGLAYYSIKKTTPYFEGKATLTFSDFNKKIYGEMVEKLRALCHSGSYDILAEKLQLPAADVKSIIDIEAVNIAGSPLADDITESKQPFYIRVKLKDRKIADSLLLHTENYLNHNPQVKTLIESNTGKMKERLAYTNYELQKLDSLKSVYQFYLSSQTAHSGNVINTFNPVDLFTASEKLMVTKTDLEWGIHNYRVVKILDPFVMNAYPVSPSLAQLLGKYLLLGLLLGVILSLLLYTFKKIYY